MLIHRLFKHELNKMANMQSHICPACPKVTYYTCIYPSMYSHCVCMSPIHMVEGNHECTLLTVPTLVWLQADSLDPLVLSMDANFRLCRRKNAAKVNTAPPLLQDHFFFPQQEVDDYVESRSRSTLVYMQVKYWISSKESVKFK